MADIEEIGTLVEENRTHLEDVAVSLTQVNGFYLRHDLGHMIGQDGRKVDVALTGLCFLVERGGRYILIDPVAALQRAANIILEQEDAAKKEAAQ